jgi:hypothetical protein
VGACYGDLDAGTNFEILAERGCEKQLAAAGSEAFYLFSVYDLPLALVGSSDTSPVLPAVTRLDGERRLLVSGG